MENLLKITPENYFSLEAKQQYMGVSQFKSFLECEAATMAEIKGEYSREESDALLFGKALHAWNQGVLPQFKKDHPELYKKDGTIYAKFEGIEACIETLQNDSVCMMALEGEKEVIFTANLFGAPWKIMIDSYNESFGMFSDLKTMKSLYDRFWSKENSCYVNFVEYYGYDIQMAVYSEVERLANGRTNRLEPHIVAVTKETPPDKAVITGFISEVDRILTYAESKMPRILEIKHGGAIPTACGKCDYCRSTKKALIIDYQDLLI